MKYAVNMAIKYNIEVEISLEREFACGIGVCMGCTFKLKIIRRLKINVSAKMVLFLTGGRLYGRKNPN